MKKICMAVADTAISDGLYAFLLERDLDVERVPYAQGIVPTLKGQPQQFSALILCIDIFKEPWSQEALELILWIRHDASLSSINLLFLCPVLGQAHPLYSELIRLGVYNILNSSSISFELIFEKLTKPSSYADVQHLLKASKPSISIPSPKVMPLQERVEQVITLRQKLYSVVSLYPAGASLLAMNIADMAVRRGRKVTLWDADIRFPGLYYLFGLDQGPYEFNEINAFHMVPITEGFSLYTWSPHQAVPIEQHYYELYPAFRETSDISVIDLSGRYESRVSDFILKQSNRIYVVLDPNPLQWIQHLRVLSEFIGSYGATKVHLVLNRATASTEKLHLLARELWGQKIVHVLPDVQTEFLQAFMKSRPLNREVDLTHPFCSELEKMLEIEVERADSKWLNRIWKKTSGAR